MFTVIGLQRHPGTGRWRVYTNTPTPELASPPAGNGKVIASLRDSVGIGLSTHYFTSL